MEQQFASQRIVFTGRKIELRVVEVDLGDGLTASRELVVHPGAVVILPLTDAGDVVMIRNTRFAVGEELWELPAGALEPGEDPRDCAARELIEETGCQARKLEPLAVFYSTPGFCNEKLHCFTATELTDVGQQLEPGERIRVEIIRIGQVRRMMLSGEIADGKTLAALGVYLLRKGE